METSAVEAAMKRPHEKIAGSDVPEPAIPPKQAKLSEEPSEPPQENPQAEGSSTPKEKGQKGERKTHKQKKADKRAGRRDRRRSTKPQDGEEGEREGSSEPKAPRLPKRQCALLIGYSGAGYSGMQVQPGDVKTIEGTLFNALVKVGAVSQDNSDDPVKVNLGRAARTDAGVHAAGNLISMKLISTIPGVTDLVARVNEELPPEIRLWSYVRVQNSFNARGICDSRKYTYFFPSYLLIPPKPGSGLHKTFNSQADADYTPQTHPFWAEASPESTPQEDMQRKRQWRAPPEVIQRLRDAASNYVGSHNFHNFTVARTPKDPSCKRYMKEITIADPVVYGDTEWISVLLHGQSFMFHQRKMIAALILTVRTGTPPDVIKELYGHRAVFIPRMPALGLLLEYPLFESYNKKTEETRQKYKPTDHEYRLPIDFEAHREAIDKFKQDFIYSGMRKVEDRDGIFDAWIRTVDTYQGNDLLWLNPSGKIPPEAVIEQGVRRPNPFRERKRFDATTFPEDGHERVADVNDDSDVEIDEAEGIDKKKLVEMEG